MQCIVPNCGYESSKTSPEISYHLFPSAPLLRAAWLKALGAPTWEPKAHSAVCSEHFLKEDLLVSNNGLRVLRAGAVPFVDLPACRICFATGCKLYPMTSQNILYVSYENLTGLLISTKDNFPPYLCSECARRLLNCTRFRDTSLQAHSRLMELVKDHGCITLELIQSIKDQSSLGINKIDCELEIEFIKRENIDTDEQSDINHSPGLYEDINSDCCKIKTDNVINVDNKSENTINSKIYMSAFPKNIPYDIKVENDCVVKQECANIDSSNDDMKQGDSFRGEDYSSNGHPPLVDGRQKDKLSTTAVQQVTEVPIESPHEKIDILWSPGLVNNTLSCHICPYRTNIKLHLLSHLKAHASTVFYSCNMCNYITINRCALTHHSKIHSGKKPYSCNVCNKSFLHKNNLGVHMSSHSRDNVCSCVICNKTFYHKDLLTKHLKTHSDVKPYSCDVCNKTFNRKPDLTRHSWTHSGVKPYSCDFCDKTFTQKCVLTRHLLIHSGEKPYSCDICVKTFNQKSALTSHLKMHSRVKPYSCDICHKAFYDKNNLIPHLRIHSGLKPYSCEFCHKAFNNKSKLIVHSRTHSGAKPYSCDVCKKKFTFKGSLTVHLLAHSNKKA